jgi:hypothetical protein
MQRLFSTLLCASLAVSDACANEVFVLKVQTAGTAVYDLGGGGTKSVEFPWSGAMRFVYVSDADCVYKGQSLVSLAFGAKLRQRVGDISFFTYGSPSCCIPVIPASVTIEGGQVTDVDVGYTFHSSSHSAETVDVSGLTARFSSSSSVGLPPGYVGVTASAVGPLVPVPEPSTWAMLLAGLAGLAWTMLTAPHTGSVQLVPMTRRS